MKLKYSTMNADKNHSGQLEVLRKKGLLNFSRNQRSVCFGSGTPEHL